MSAECRQCGRAGPIQTSRLVGDSSDWLGARGGGRVAMHHRRPDRRSGLRAANFRFRWSLAKRLEQRLAQAEREGQPELTRAQEARMASKIWREAGATTVDRVRIAFSRTMQAIGLTEVTCPKNWRHTFATLLQDANVDPLVRQVTLGHQLGCPSLGALGMTSVYTHTRQDTQSREIHRALRLWPRSLELAQRWAEGGKAFSK